MRRSSTKNVEACITYLDWLATQEGGFTLYHGFEGEHFQYADEIPVAMDVDYNAKDKDWINNDLFSRWTLRDYTFRVLFKYWS